MAVEIMLSDKQKAEIQEELYGMVSNTIDNVKKSVGINSKAYFNRKEAAKYIGCANNTLDKFLAEGLPSHTVQGYTVYSRKEIDDFIASC